MKVLMIVNTDGALYVFRKPILEKLLALGHAVSSISGKSRYFGRLKALGVDPASLDFARHSVSPLKNVSLIIRLFKLIKHQRPDIVHNFTHKPAILGTIAARLAKVPGIFVTVTGLGTLFLREDIKARMMRSLLLWQYKFALQFADAVFFQNPDDMLYFTSRNILPIKKAVLTHGSGIDLNEFKLPTLDEVNFAKVKLGSELAYDVSNKRIVLFPARGIPEKGLFEFYKAAKFIHKHAPENYLFIHLGLIDAASTSQLSKASIEEFASECGVKYMGYKDNFQDYLRAADIVTLPSYGEGTPRSILEALAFGKTIVTTEVNGCRETVVDGWNGYLCKVGDVQSLVKKILAVDIAMISDARIRSRQYCVSKFDAAWLVDLTLVKYFEVYKTH
jgi:N,N'-diacetylbacillosaminyl-diphospho-undecaprenol alpha-1,3-N-acetylgalactosaminyltransferase